MSAARLRVPAYYHPDYAGPAHPLYARLQATASLLTRLGLVELRKAAPAAPDVLSGLHEPRYLDAFLHGHEPMASRQGIQWSPAVRDATLAMLGGQLAAAEAALDEGLSMNIARGFHHAVYDAGCGFCPINGLALLAHVMPQRRVLVLDCDEHGGNGTEDFAARLPNLFNVSIFGTRFGCRGGTRSWAMQVAPETGFDGYRVALENSAELVDTHQPDLLVYQAGADCHLNDPKSRLRLGSAELFRRDLFVFATARQRRLPVLFVIAGGYQAGERVARLNANTVRAARLAWQHPERALAAVARQRALP